MKQVRGMTSSIFHIDELTDSTEDVIFESGDVKVSVVKYVKREDNLYVALELGERFLIEATSSEGKAVQTLDFQRTHKGDVTCSYGITDQALATILKFRLQKRLEADETGCTDRVVLHDVIKNLNTVIDW